MHVFPPFLHHWKPSKKIAKIKNALTNILVMLAELNLLTAFHSA